MNFTAISITFAAFAVVYLIAALTFAFGKPQSDGVAFACACVAGYLGTFAYVLHLIAPGA